MGALVSAGWRWTGRYCVDIVSSRTTVLLVYRDTFYLAYSTHCSNTYPTFGSGSSAVRREISDWTSGSAGRLSTLTSCLGRVTYGFATPLYRERRTHSAHHRHVRVAGGFSIAGNAGLVRESALSSEATRSIRQRMYDRARYALLNQIQLSNSSTCNMSYRRASGAAPEVRILVGRLYSDVFRRTYVPGNARHVLEVDDGLKKLYTPGRRVLTVAWHDRALNHAKRHGRGRWRSEELWAPMGDEVRLSSCSDVKVTIQRCGCVIGVGRDPRWQAATRRIRAAPPRDGQPISFPLSLSRSRLTTTMRPTLILLALTAGTAVQASWFSGNTNNQPAGTRRLIGASLRSTPETDSALLLQNIPHGQRRNCRTGSTPTTSPTPAIPLLRRPSCKPPSRPTTTPHRHGRMSSSTRPRSRSRATKPMRSTLGTSRASASSSSSRAS